MKTNLIYLVALALFSLSLVSANGLVVSQGNYTNITKTYNQNKLINITITNSEPITFYNISINKIDGVSMQKIPKLESGQSATTQLILNENNNLNTTLTIFGFYLATLGQHNETYNIEVNSNGVSKCSISATIGSKVLWTNPEITPTQKYNIINTKTGDVIHTLLYNSTWLQYLDRAGQIPFHIVDRTGFSGDNCMITVLSDTGYINNPDYDAKYNLDLVVNYPKATLKTDFLSTKYNISFSDKKQDIFSIRNTGTTIAKDISLSGDWFDFSSNHFDLNAGESKNIGYTISPNIQYSNQTGKSYTKQILITGNFNMIKQNISINVKYANIVNQSSSNVTSLKDYICKNFPEFCKPQVIYKYVAKGDEKVNVSFTENQVRDLYKLFFNFSDAQAIREKQAIAYKNSANETLTEMRISLQQNNANLKSLKESINTSNNSWLFTGFMVLLITIGALIILLIFRYKSIADNNEWTKYT